MVSSGITEGILLIASILVASGLSAVVLTKAGALNSAVTVTTEAQKDITLTKVKIVYAIGNSSSSTVKVWAKNIGSTPINNLDKVDVYFGKVGSTVKIPYDTAAPSWTYSASMTQWQTKDTVQIDISNGSNLSASSTYIVRITMPNGVTDEYLFST